MPENDVPRRTFLRGVTAATALSYSRVYGANERVQLGLVGAGERGRGDMGKFVKSGIVDVTAVCDVYGNQIDAAQQITPKAKGFSDIALLEMKEVDAVLIGVPDH
jgi:predicted dehydrogenase